MEAESHRMFESVKPALGRTDLTPGPPRGDGEVSAKRMMQSMMNHPMLNPQGARPGAFARESETPGITPGGVPTPQGMSSVWG